MPRAKKKDETGKPKEENGILEIAPGYFRLRWREPDPDNPGKTQRCMAFFPGTKKEAKDERDRLRGLALAGKKEIKPRRKTLQDLADEFLVDREIVGDQRYRSMEFHDDNLRVHIIPGLGGPKFPIDQITTAMCKLWLKSLRVTSSRYGRPYSRSSRDDYRRTMFAMFKFAVAQNYIENNPVAGIKITDDDDQNAVPDIQRVKAQAQKEIMAPVLTLAQRRELVLAAVGDEFYVAICLMIETGKRRGEILGIKRTDIDWKTGLILIYKSVQRIRGKGIKAGPLKGKRKGEKLISVIMVGSEMLELLRQHNEQQERIKKSLGERYHDEGWVFPRHNGKIWDPKTFSNHVKDLFPKIGLPKGLAEKMTLHNLRDDYVTDRFSRGDDIDNIRFDVDHETILTTLGYTHETIEEKKKAASEREKGLTFLPLWCAGQHATVDPAI